MRSERFAAAEADTPTIGPGTLILSAIGCFAIGFAALMIVPHFWPRYVQVAHAATSEPVHIAEAGVVIPEATPAPAAAGVITEINVSGPAPEPQRVASFGTLAGLAECKAAMRAGATFAKIGPAQMAALFGTRGKPLTNAQIDAGCHKLTE